MSSQPANANRGEALRVWLRCDLAEVRPSTTTVAEFLGSKHLSDEEIQGCELALVEALNNAIYYAEGAARSAPVEVDVVCSETDVEFRVLDRTAGFNLPKDLALPGPEQENGRGLFLISSVMDDVRYFRGGDSNCLVMRKQRRSAMLAPLSNATEEVSQEVRRRLGESEQIISDMAEELSFCYESLSAIFRCSAELGHSSDLEEFAQRLLTDLAQISSAEWFLLRIVAKEESRLVVFTASEPALQLAPLILGPAHSSGSGETEAAATGQDVWFDEQRPLRSPDPLAALKSGSVGMIHPFYAGDTLIGTLAVGKPRGEPQFSAVHANVIHTFTDFLAIQIVNARFQEEQFTTRIFSRELEIARNIQRTLLPKALPQFPGITISGYCESARQVGGDFYDVLEIDGECLLLIIADVMGKGIPAAIFAAILRSLLRAAPEWTSDPGGLLTRVNRLLYDELSGVDMFITAQLILVDTRSREVTAASAGHCPALVSVDGPSRVKTLVPDGLPLGIVPDTVFHNQKETLAKEGRVLLYTDGLTEARNARGEFFGQERLMEWFESYSTGSHAAEELKGELAKELSGFQAEDVLQDDQTFLILSTSLR